MDIRLSASPAHVSVPQSGQVTFSVTTEVINPPVNSEGVTIYADCLADSTCVIKPSHVGKAGTAQVTLYASQQTPVGTLPMKIRATEIHNSPVGVLGGRIAVTKTIEIDVSVNGTPSNFSFKTKGHRVRSQPNNLGVGDLDGNGVEDIVFDVGSYLMWLRDEDGHMSSTDINIDLATGSALDVVVADVDGDGRNDVALSEGPLRVLRNVGFGWNTPT